MNRFFITYRKPIRTAHRNIVERWTKSIMKESGVDTKIFKPHNSRSASASAATNPGGNYGQCFETRKLEKC